MNTYHYIVTELNTLIHQHRAEAADPFPAVQAFIADKELLSNFDWLQDTSEHGTRGRQRTEACVDALTGQIERVAHLWYEPSPGSAVNAVALSYLAVIHSQRRWNAPHHHDLNSALDVLRDPELDKNLRHVIARIVGLGHAVRACTGGNFNEVAGAACELEVLMTFIVGKEHGDNAKAIRASAITLAACLAALHGGGLAYENSRRVRLAGGGAQTAYIVEYGTTFREAVQHAVARGSSASLVLISAAGFVNQDTPERELFDVMPAADTEALSALYGCDVEVKGSRPSGAPRALLTNRLEQRPLKQINGVHYIPLPLVERCLKDLFRQRPDEFHTLTFEFTPAVPISWLPAIDTIPLPKPALLTDNDTLSATVERAVETRQWTHPALVLARFAAATLSNVRTLFGPGELKVRPWRDTNTMTKAGAIEWMKALGTIWAHNHEATFDLYFEQISAPSELGRSGTTIPFGKGARVLVLEVGGTHIKYRLSDSSEAGQQAFATAPDGEQYTSAEAFAERVRKEVFDGQAPDLHAIIMTWPGAVHAPLTPKSQSHRHRRDLGRLRAV
ncbi:MAG: hypothetical protein GKR94_02650 [Gammaproteobacteria bacterium]|nr:hypothetical protein [Gammaproteobacteria bacterium]